MTGTHSQFDLADELTAVRADLAVAVEALEAIGGMGYAGAPDLAMRRIARIALAKLGRDMGRG